MSRPTSASGVAEVSAPLRRGVSPGAEVASGDGQLRHAQRAARASVAEEASSFCVPLCADQFKLVESGGALVSRIDRESDSARQFRECAGSKAGDRGIYASLERKPQAVHLERHCRRDHQKDRSRAGQDGADQTRIHPAQREKEGRCSVKLYTGHTTSYLCLCPLAHHPLQLKLPAASGIRLASRFVSVSSRALELAPSGPRLVARPKQWQGSRRNAFLLRLRNGSALQSCSLRFRVAWSQMTALSKVEKVDLAGVGLNATDTLIPVAHYPARGTKVEIRPTPVLPGGQTATAVVACQQWGLRTRYVGTVGGDSAAALHAAEFSRLGVEAHLITAPDCPSQQALILVDDSGERTVLWRRDHRLALRPEELNAI